MKRKKRDELDVETGVRTAECLIQRMHFLCYFQRLSSTISSTEVLVCEKVNVGQTKGPHWLTSCFQA